MDEQRSSLQNMIQNKIYAKINEMDEQINQLETQTNQIIKIQNKIDMKWMNR